METFLHFYFIKWAFYFLSIFMIVLVNMSFTSYFPSLVQWEVLHGKYWDMLGNIQLTFRRTVYVRTRVDAMASYDWMACILQLLIIRAATANSLNFMVGLMRLCIEWLFSFYSNYKIAEHWRKTQEQCDFFSIFLIFCLYI